MAYYPPEGREHYKGPTPPRASSPLVLRCTCRCLRAATLSPEVSLQPSRPTLLSRWSTTMATRSKVTGAFGIFCHASSFFSHRSAHTLHTPHTLLPTGLIPHFILFPCKSVCSVRPSHPLSPAAGSRRSSRSCARLCHVCCSALNFCILDSSFDLLHMKSPTLTSSPDILTEMQLTSWASAVHKTTLPLLTLRHPTTGALERRFIHFAHTFAVDVVLYDYLGCAISSRRISSPHSSHPRDRQSVINRNLPSSLSINHSSTPCPNSCFFPLCSYGLSSGDAPDERLCELSVEAV